MCPRVGVLSLLRPGVLSGRQGFTLPHTHSDTHMERNPGRQDFTTHTRRHTPHTVTHAHTRTQSHAHTHAHTHTQGQAHAHKHIQTHAHKTHTRSTHFPYTKPVMLDTFIPKLFLTLLWFFRRTAALFRQIRTFPQLFPFCSDLGNPGIRQIVRDSMLTGR